MLDKLEEKDRILEGLRTLKINLTENNKNLKINDIIYLGEVKWKELEKDKSREIEKKESLYLVKEQESLIYKYYLGNEFIGIYSEEIEYVTGEKFIPNKGINSRKLSKIEMLLGNVYQDEQDEISLNYLEKERIENISKKLGVRENKIESIDEVRLNQVIDEENKSLSKEETKKLDTKEETKLNQTIKGQTLGNKLGLGKDFVKLAVISTSQVKGKKGKENHNKESFVAIKANGESEVLGDDILKMDEQSGVNPSKEDLTINNDGKVEREVNTSSYKIVNGNGKEYLKIGNDENFGKEIKYSQWSQEKGQYVNLELETQKTRKPDNNVRKFAKDRSEGINEATNIIERDEKHDECDQKDVTIVDNDKNNDSHDHVQECINELMECEIIDVNYTEKEIRQYFEYMMEEHSNWKLEKIKEYVQDDLEKVAPIKVKDEHE